MPYNSPLSALSMWMTFSVQIACGYVLTRILSALFRSHRVRLRLWTCFLILTISGWIFISVPTPAGRSVEISTLAGHQSPAPHWSWPVSDSLADDVDRLGAWVAWTYLSVVAVSLVQLLAKRLWLGLVLRNRQDAPPELLVLFGALCQEMKVRRCQLSLLPKLRSPATTSWFRPHVLLPMELVPRLNSDQLAQILRHELVHVKRHDYLWDRLAALACRILFFHPAVWLAYRRMRWERELACDQAVVENSWESRLPYAECLTGLARWWFIAEKSPSSGIGFSSSPSLLATRIRELLREPQRVSIFERGLRAGLIAAMFVVGVLFLPGVALNLYRSGSPLRGFRLPAATLNSASRIKATPVQVRRAEPIQSSDVQSPNVQARAKDQDRALNLFMLSGTGPMPIYRNSPPRSSGEGTDKRGSPQDKGGLRQSPDLDRAWAEASAPRSRAASTTLREAAIDAIRIGAAAMGGGHDSNSEGTGGEQGNHLQ